MNILELFQSEIRVDIFLICLLSYAVISFWIFTLIRRLKFVQKTDFEAQRKQIELQLNELSVVKEKLRDSSEDYEKISEQLFISEKELKTLLGKTSAQEATIGLLQEKVVENQSHARHLSGENEKLNLETDTVRQEIARSKAELEFSVEKEKSTQLISGQYFVKIENLEDQLSRLTFSSSKISLENEILKRNIELQKSEIEEFRKTSRLEFENVANQILKSKSAEFTETNRLNIESILKPLSENIDHFKKQVETVYEKESKQRFSLEQKVKELVEQTNKVSSEANNLASALKGQSKTQGNWGEMILENILEKSGLVKDREYFVQPTISGSGGKVLRPDVIVKLPGERSIIIDSKVSLVNYEKYCSEEDKTRQDQELARHVKSIYSHIDDLSSKNYDDLSSSLDFTMMFIPIEPAYLVAIQSDTELWSYAYSKRILLISPTNLITAMKLVEDIWKREMQNKNAMEIAKRGELLYEKFVSFTESLESIGKHIYKVQASYNSAINQLREGPGNLVGQVQKLKALGLKSSKEIPAGIALPNSDEQPDELFLTAEAVPEEAL